MVYLSFCFVTWSFSVNDDENARNSVFSAYSLHFNATLLTRFSRQIMLHVYISILHLKSWVIFWWLTQLCKEVIESPFICWTCYIMYNIKVQHCIFYMICKFIFYALLFTKILWRILDIMTLQQVKLDMQSPPADINL